MKKIYLLITIVLTMLILSGCNIKFIEKIETTPTPTPPEEIFGEITIIPSTPTPTPSNEFSEDWATEVYAGVLFYIKDTTSLYYCKMDGFAKIYPNEESRNYLELKKGDSVTLKGISADKTWAWISVYGEIASFIQMDMLVAEDEEPTPDLSPTPEITQSPTQDITPTPEVQPSPTTTPEPTQKPTPTPEATQEPTSTPIPTVTPTPEITQEPTTTPNRPNNVVTFPENPKSTFFNLGVEFAELDILLTVTKSNTIISSGPDEVSEWTGYEAVAVLNKGNMVKCIGIGRNGWAKVIYNGKTGYIDAQFLTY